jgi:hypothetical protein
VTNVIDGIPTITIQRITAALVLMIVGFWLIDGLFLFAFSGLYLVFIIVTILVVRSVPVQPGHWLARQRVRRASDGKNTAEGQEQEVEHPSGYPASHSALYGVPELDTL